MVTTMEDFIREKIKDKPVNKKKIFIKVGVSALCGIVFAVTASIVFCILVPHFPEKDDNEQIGKGGGQRPDNGVSQELAADQILVGLQGQDEGGDADGHQAHEGQLGGG